MLDERFALWVLKKSSRFPVVEIEARIRARRSHPSPMQWQQVWGMRSAHSGTGPAA